jgi:PST family polysaccharide transporter
MAQSLTRTTTHGALYSAGTNILIKVLSLVVQVVLAWMLGPEAFGAWALTMPVMTLSELIRTSGAREILVRRQRAFRVWAGPAFWLSALMGVAASLFTASLALPMALIYDRPELVILILLCVPAPLLGSLQSVPEAFLLAKNRFRAHAMGLFVPGVALLVFQLLFAAIGLGAKTFPLALVVSAAMRAVMFWFVGNPRCSLHPRTRRWKYIVADAGRLVGTRFADWFSVNAPPLVLGLYFNNALVGVFAYAVNTSSQAIRILAVNVSTILFAALAGNARDPARQESGFLKSIGVLSTIGIPLCFMQAALAEPLFNNVLKIEEWPGLIVSFQLLSIGMGFRLLSQPSRSFLLAQGRFSAALWLSILSALLYLIGAVAAGPFGVVVLAASHAVIHIITAFAWYIGSLNRSPQGTRRGITIVLPILIASTLGILLPGALAHRFYAINLWTDIAVGAAVAVLGSALFVVLCLVFRARALTSTANWAIEMAPPRVASPLSRLCRVLRITT